MAKPRIAAAAALLAFVHAAPGLPAAVTATEIRCIGRDSRGREHEILISGGRLLLRENGKTRKRWRVRERAVVGEGAAARTVIRFRTGEFSFFDEYGCVRTPKLEVRGRAVEWPLDCRSEGAPACSPPATRSQ